MTLKIKAEERANQAEAVLAEAVFPAAADERTDQEQAVFDEKHEALVTAATLIGMIPDMSHWVTAGMTARLGDRDIENITIGELLSIRLDTVNFIEDIMS